MRVGLLLAAIVALAAAQAFRYGNHYPEGAASVEYAYGPSGTWKHLAKIEYLWNYYNWSDNPKNHPYDKERLIGTVLAHSAYSDGNNYTTCRDANRHLLLDYNHDGQIDVGEDAGWAFHEHNGRGVNDTSQGTPFSNFWFDDNGSQESNIDLASVMARAYDKPLPTGLSNYSDFTRWQIMKGNATGWKPYGNNDYLDLVALDGLYDIAMKLKTNATTKFAMALTLAKAAYNNDTLRFDYFIEENYKLGLLAVFASFLYEYTLAPAYLQHYIALRSNLLSKLQRGSNPSTVYSWMVFNNSNPGNLFNTETMVLGTLGLSAGASSILEVVWLPEDPTVKYLNNTQTWMRSARIATCKPGYMARHEDYQPSDANQNYTVEFVLRAFNTTPSATAVRLEVAESTGKNTNTRLVRQQDFQLGNWTLFRMDFITTKNKWNFNIYWMGVADIDASIIRIKKPLATTAEH